MLKIYGVPVSVHTRKVIVVAIAKNIPHKIVPVAPVIPDTLPADWPQLSPTGMIPVLVEGDFTISDSAAICAYLERMHPDSRVYPEKSRDYATALWLEQYAGATLFRNVVHPLFHEMVVHPGIQDIPTDQSRVDAVLTQALPPIFGYLDSIAGDGFLVGKTLSIADVAVVSNLITYQYLGFDLCRDRYPQLTAFHDRIIGHPAMNEALRREQETVTAMGLRNDFLETALL